MSLEQRLAALEHTVKDLQQKYRGFGKLVDLIESTPHLFDIEVVVQTNTRQARALTHALSQNRDLLKTLKAVLPSCATRLQGQLTAATQRRDRSMLMLENKMNAVDSLIAQTWTGFGELPGQVQRNIIQDFCNRVKNAKNQLDLTLRSSTSKVNNTRASIRKRCGAREAEATQIQEALATYQRARGASLATLAGGQDSQTETGRAKVAQWLVAGSSSSTFSAIAEFKANLESEFQQLTFRCQQQTLEFRLQLLATRHGVIDLMVKASKKPDLQLTNAIKVLKARKTNLSQYAAGVLETVLWLLGQARELPASAERGEFSGEISETANS